jgi:hypothetical protein
MKIEDFKEQINFASDAIRNKTNEDNGVRVLVKLKNRSVVLDVIEVGFNDKEGIIYIEVEPEK